MRDHGQAVQKGQLPVVPPVYLPERLHDKLDDRESHDKLERIRDHPSGDVGRILNDRHDSHFDDLGRHVHVMDQFPECFSHLQPPCTITFLVTLFWTKKNTPASITSHNS